MRSRSALVTICTWLMALLAPYVTPCKAANKAANNLNVLFIAVDDLRPELNCYGKAHIRSPNIDGLASRGLIFQRAFCQQAVCNPSRTSLMTGLRPDTIGVTGNHVHFRAKHPDVVTLPQHFKNHGYHAQSIGKIYHGLFPEGASKTVWDTMGDPPSWSVPTTRFGPRYYYTEEGIRQARQAYTASYRPENPAADDWTKKLVFGPMTEAPDVPDNTLYDGKVADAAIQALHERKGRADQPFFLAVGFIKPHTPFVAPKKYWDLYDAAEIQLAEHADFPRGAPPFAGHGSHEVRRYTDQPKRGPFSEANQRRLRHGYYACISYIDAQVGRVLDELDRLGLRENTIVLLYGDHGWHLGEQGLWGKTTNFELDTKAPLIVSAPGQKTAGQKTQALVEFVDIYPTLAALAGLPLAQDLEGTSFAPLLDEPGQDWKPAAFSQYPRGGNADKGGKLMGYSMRTDRYRYTEWIDRGARQVAARELYDHGSDPHETINIAALKENAALVTQFSEQLDQGRGWRNAKPPGAVAAAADAIAARGGTELTTHGTENDETTVIIANGKLRGVGQAARWQQRDGYVEGAGANGLPVMAGGIGKGDFHIESRLRIRDQKASAASFFLDDNHFGFEGNRQTLYLNGPIFDGLQLLRPAVEVFKRESWIEFDVIRIGTRMSFFINGNVVHATDDGGREYRRVGFNPFRSTINISDFSVAGHLLEPPDLPPIKDVFVPGTDKYPRIRIPSLVATKKGTLLAFAEGRQGGDHSENDIILKRSKDHGKTWEALRIVHEAGDHSLNNPQAVVLPDTGRILLIYQRNKFGERQVQPGYDSEGAGYTLLQVSDDDGTTWSKPRDITRGVKRPAPITSHASGPGVGIVLQRGKYKGRVLMPFNQGPFGKWKVYAAYSDDQGETWQIGEVAPEGDQGQGNEVQMVELTDGTVLLNSRTQGGTKHRKVALSRDGGLTWSPLLDDPMLIEPQCQGTILRYSWPEEGRGRILFANPATQTGRVSGKVRLSYDDGKTWPVEKTVYEGGFAYSCLTTLPDGSIGLLFERDGYRAIAFTRITLDWLTGGQDAIGDAQ